MTNFKPNKTVWVGSQLSYLDHISEPSEAREDLYCLTLAQTEALIAVIEHYRYRSRWIDDDTILTTEIVQFVNDTQRRLMMPCGSDNIIVLSQFDPTGHYEESTDGGVTYHEAPLRDPRNSVTLPPPFLPPGTEEAECTYADAIVNQFINSWINATGEGEDLATVIAGILSFLAGIFGSVGAIVAAVVLSIAASVVAGTVIAWKEAFTSDVFDRLRCNLHDNQQADGSFTAADVDAIYARLGDEETGIVLISLQQMVAALGWQGLTIAARTGVGSPTADCACSDRLRVYVNNVGTEDAWEDDTLSCSPQFAAGYYQVWVQLTNSYVFGDVDYSLCATFDYTVTSGTMDSVAAIWVCPSTSPSDPGLTPISDFCCSLVAFKSTVPFTLDVWAVDCP